MSSLSEELKWRGFTNQTTLPDAKTIDTEKLTFYWGVDPSADSMTVGNLAIAMMVRHFISHGHNAVLLVGGATGIIGDPDGKSEERTLKTNEELERNKKGISAQYERIFAGQNFDLVDNYEWFKNISYLSFLRDVGKHFSMTQLLDREFVQARIGEGGRGISYAEFSYSLIQGYDFLHLFREKGVSLQVCGADQWGNSLAGVELIRKLEGKNAHVWSAPLVIDKSTGKKFGKTEAGAVWLDDNQTSAYQFYQFWLNSSDESVVDFLKIYTLLSRSEIESLSEEVKTNPGARQAQKTLAFEVTKIVHGQERAETARNVTEILFQGGQDQALGEAETQMLKEEIATAKPGQTIVKTLVASGLASSNSEALRFIKEGAVSIAGEKIQDDRELSTAPILIKRGKNKFCLVTD